MIQLEKHFHFVRDVNFDEKINQQIGTEEDIDLLNETAVIAWKLMEDMIFYAAGCQKYNSESLGLSST